MNLYVIKYKRTGKYLDRGGRPCTSPLSMRFFKSEEKAQDVIDRGPECILLDWQNGETSADLAIVPATLTIG